MTVRGGVTMFHRILALGLLVLAAAGLPAAAAEESPPLVALADPGDWTVARHGRAGLARALDLSGDPILVVTGGALVSAGAPAGREDAFAVAMLEAAGADVVNLAQRDLAGDPAARAAALAESKVAFLSATFRLREGRKTPWSPTAVVTRGGARIGFVGVAARSLSVELEGRGEGLAFVEPADAIRAALASLAGKADRIVLLADAPLPAVSAWLAAFPAIDFAVMSGRAGVTGEGRIVLAPTGGRAVGVAGAGATAVRAARLPEPAEPAPAYAAAARRFGVSGVPAEIGPAPEDRAGPAPLAGLEPGRTVPVAFAAGNRAIDFRISSVALLDRFGDRRAEPGERILALRVRFENRLTPEVLRENLVPVAMQIPKLADHLHVVADGRALLPPLDARDAAGTLSWGGLTLPGPGATASGHLLFTVPGGLALSDLELRFYDYVHGSFTIPLVRDGDGPAPAPVTAGAANEVLDAVVGDVEREAEHDGVAAPEGTTWLAVELRARSMLTIDADATAFDPKARPGDRITMGTLADWTDWRRHTFLVADGEYAGPVRDTDFPETPRFLPDLRTGARLWFLAPAGATSLELLCGMPHAALPDGSVIDPAPLRFPLAGEAPELPERPALLAFEDGPFLVAATGQRRAASFAGVRAPAGASFRIVAVTVANRGEEAETFRPAEQLALAGPDGALAATDEAGANGPHAAADRLWIPVGERRSFEVVFVETGAAGPRNLSYRGVTMAEAKALPPLAGGATPAAAAPEAEPPSEEPPAEEPPAEQPPAEQPPAEQPPAEQPPAEQPPAEQPPAEQPPAEQPPAEQPPAEEPPAEEPAGGEVGAAAKAPPLFPEPAPQGIAGVGLRAEQVNEAIRKGAAWLLASRKRGFSPTEVREPLVILALLHSGELPKNPEAFARAVECLEKRKIGSTYDAALTIMGLAALDPVRYRPRIRRIAQVLVDGQCENGCWTYLYDDFRKLAAAEEAAPEPKPEPGRLEVTGGEPIPGWPGTEPEKGEPLVRRLPFKYEGGDNSCSQYALLGLLAASRAGLEIPRETWERAAKWYREGHNPGAGWGYESRYESTGAMTAAGLGGFAVVRHMLGDVPGAEDVLAEGVDWLARNFRLDGNPAADSWHYYWLYGLERAGRLLGKEFIGSHEWYPQGARYLVDFQKPDGSWTGNGGNRNPLQDTCFAVLFLTRATERLGTKEPIDTGPGRLTVLGGGAGGSLVFILDASGSMGATLGSETRFDAARRVVGEALRGCGPGLEVALRVYGHRFTSNKPEADTDSELVLDFGPADRPELAAKLASLRCRGKTPLTYSVLQALEDLKHASPDARERRVILLTDGMETDRRAKPVDAARALRAAGARLDVVCLAMETTDLLGAMAEAGGGRCWSAADAEGLKKALASVLGGEVAFEVLSPDGKKLAAGKAGDVVELPAGPYRVRVLLPEGPAEVDAWIHAGALTSIAPRR